MKKRPLCLLCMILVICMCIFRASVGSWETSDVPDLPGGQAEAAPLRLTGQIYRCEYKEDKLILFLKQTILSVDSKQKVQLKNVRISCKDREAAYEPGDRICAEGMLRSVSAPTNPGEFDAENYYGAEKVSYTMWEPKLKLQSRPAFSFLRTLARIRERLQKALATVAPKRESGVLQAMLLGEKGNLEQEVRTLYRQGGLSHSIAISGLHLGVLGMSLYRILGKCGMGTVVSGLVSSLIMGCYGMLTGAGAATLRALVMFVLMVGANILGRTYDRPTGLALAAILLLAGNPDYLFYSGFLLSFSAVSSFMIFQGKNALADGVCLYFFMAPVVLYFFYELPLFSIFLNLLVVPTLGIVLLSGLFGCLLGLISTALGSVVILPAVKLLQIYEYLCEVTGEIPGAVQIIGRPEPIRIVLYYLILAVMLWGYRRVRIRKRRFLVLLAFLPAWLVLTVRFPAGLTVAMLDVGQGDSIVISTDSGRHYLVDGGSTTKDKIGEYRLVPYLKYRGIRKLEAVFLSHPDEDHISGIMELLDLIEENSTALRIGRVVLPDWRDREMFEPILQAALEAKIPVTWMGRGESMRDGETLFTCLHPGRKDYGTRTNAGSLVLRVDYRKFSALFTGDLEGIEETGLIYKLTDIDLLKVAHHGSKNSTGADFLKVTKPEVSLISAGENNRYGHPHLELLLRLREVGSAVYETAKGGAITLRTDGERIDLQTHCAYNDERE